MFLHVWCVTAGGYEAALDATFTIGSVTSALEQPCLFMSDAHEYSHAFRNA